jgi:hypothetical protein
MNPAVQPVLTVALPIIVTILAAMWASNSRLTDLRMKLHNSLGTFREDTNRQFADVVSRLDRIEHKLDSHEERLVRLEERTSLRRR